jgi:hypothetical protein
MDPATEEAQAFGTENIRMLTCEEGRDLLERQTRRFLGMSAEEFVEAWESGVFDDNPDLPGLINLAMLIPFAR